MKKIFVVGLLSLMAMWTMASHWDGPMGIYLKTNTTSNPENAVSTNYRITGTDWGSNNYSAPINGTSELNGVDLGTITSIKLNGGIYVGGTNDDNYPHHWYDEDGFKVQYCVYRQGETAPEWNDCPMMALNNKATDEYSGSNRNYVFNAINQDINLIALTNGYAGTYVLRVRMKKVKHYWNQDNSNGTWTEYSTPQEATFTIKNYVTGTGKNDANSNFCGGENWWAKYSAGEMSNGSKTYSNVAAGTYNFKIIPGAWEENEYGYSLLDADASDSNITNDGNSIKITTDAPSDITIKFDATTGKISVTSTLGRFVRTPYSVVGDPVLGINWLTDNTETEMTRQDDGTYRYIKTNVALEAHNGRKFKIVGEHSWDAYQAPKSGDFTVDIPVTGIYDLVFDFDPSTDLATCTPELHTKDVTISAYQFASFYGNKAYEIPDGLQAYIFTDVQNEMLVMEEIDVIPALTGVVLYGAANAVYSMPETQSNVTYPDNLLKGSLTNETINNSKVHYILTQSADTDEFGMYWPYNTTNGVGAFTNHAGKAYLELNPGTAPSNVKGFVLRTPQTATGIQDVTGAQDDTKWYDLLGRPVDQPTQGGVYIHQGKKIVVF